MNIHNTTLPNQLYPVANATTSSNPFVDVFQTRDPTFTDVQYPVQKKWFNTTSSAFWVLVNFTTSNGIISANWQKIGSGSLQETVTGNDAVVVPPLGNNINIVGDGTNIKTVGNAGTATLTIETAGGLATVYTEDTGTAAPSLGNLQIKGGSGIATSGAGNTVTITATGGSATTYTANSGTAMVSANNLNVLGGTGITTTGSGSTITISATTSTPLTFTANTGSATPSGNDINILGGAGISTSGSGSTITINATENAASYTNVNHAASPYTVLSTDYYLSVDTSSGPVTLEFPNAPTFKQIWIVKDRMGTSAGANISITTPGGTVTFDGQTTYTINTNYEAIQLLANANPTYEVF